MKYINRIHILFRLLYTVFLWLVIVVLVPIELIEFLLFGKSKIVLKLAFYYEENLNSISHLSKEI